MSSTIQKYGLWTLKIIAALAFVAAGLAKLSGVEMMVATFDAIGIGQWFRYLTGVIEIASAALLFIPGMQALGAVVLFGTMVGAALVHLLILGPSAVPAMILGLIVFLIAFAHRDQLPIGGSRSTI